MLERMGLLGEEERLWKWLGVVLYTRDRELFA